MSSDEQDALDALEREASDFTKVTKAPNELGVLNSPD
jgi:hypothetical protein